MGKIIFWVLVVLAILVNLVAFFGERVMKKKMSKIAKMQKTER